jgi:hypothetical protein
MTARPHDKSRTNRDGIRPDAATIPRGRPTLPPLPCLQEPLYVIGEALPHKALYDKSAAASAQSSANAR